MNKLEKNFAGLRKQKKKAFIVFITAGDPTEKRTIELARVLAESGADVIELGLPFSDPLADGPTIQKAGERALSGGMNTDRYFSLTARIGRELDVPLVCLTYYNIILQYGLEKFAQSCRKNGVSGVIVPDLPVEEAGPFLSSCRKSKVNLIFLVSETTTGGRMEKILSKASGFVYAVAILGTTGARDRVSGKLRGLIRRVKSKTRLPVAVGFGISRPEHAREVLSYGADAVIVGSAIVKKIEGSLKEERKMLSRVRSFADSMRKAI